MPSTVINHYNYDPQHRTLQIRFVSGLIYEYLQVPPEVFNAMKQSFSKGNYFNRHIKNCYAFKRVDDGAIVRN